MMKIIKPLIIIFILTSTGIIKAQTLDEILDKHFTARGQENLLKINSIKTTGKIIQGGFELTFSQIIKRPSLSRLEYSFQGLTSVQTYNGKEGWSVNAFSGSLTPEPVSEDELKTIRVEADIDGMLWKPGEKGYKISLEGKEEMEGTECFIIKVQTSAGDQFRYYIDSDSYIPLRMNSRVKVLGVETDIDQYFSNYMMISGVAIPGNIETRVKGQPAGTLIINKVETDISAENSLFEKPQKQQ